MSVKQIKELEVKCPNNHSVPIPKGAWDSEIAEVEDKSEHGMGMEVRHRYSVNGYPCLICKADINASVDVWEYPNGDIETTDKSENVVGDVAASFVAELD